MIVHHFSPVTGALHPDFVFRGACRGVHSKFLLNWVEIKKKKKIFNQGLSLASNNSCRRKTRLTELLFNEIEKAPFSFLESVYSCSIVLYMLLFLYL